MNAGQREKFIDSFVERYVYGPMASKGVEYSRGETDVNSNFKRVGEAIDADPRTVAYVYLAKHMDSIASWVKGGFVSEGMTEPISGRIGDAINYLLILASLNEEVDG